MADLETGPTSLAIAAKVLGATAFGFACSTGADFALTRLLVGSADVVPAALGLAAGHHALAGLAFAALAVLLSLLGPRRWSILHPGILLGLGGLAAAVVWLNADTFTGPRINQHPRRDLIILAFKIVVPLGLFVGLLILRAIARRRRGLAGFLLVALGAVFLAANLRVMPGLYSGFHKSLVLLALSSFGAAFMIWLPARRILALAGLVVLLSGIGAGLVVRKSDAFRLASSSLKRSNAAATEIATFTEPAFRRVIKPRVIAAEDIDLDSGDPDALRLADEALASLLPGGRQLNVLMVAIDTLRADHVGWNGYARPVTPTLDRLAADSWVFERAYTPYPTSNYAYASIFSGRYPRGTAVYGQNFGTEDESLKDQTLAAVLGRAGWRTIGIGAFNRLDSSERKIFGTLSDGFEVYNPNQLPEAMNGEQILESAIASLGGGDGRPFFMWTHFLEPHDPYEVHEGFGFGAEAIDAYDSEIAYTDSLIGRLLDALRERGLDGNTAIVVFSDHGEEFGEHGVRFHNSNLYEPQLHVPMFIHVPGVKPARARIPATVSLIDIMPTVLGLVGVKDETPRHGRNLWPLMLDPGAKDLGLAYAEHFKMFGGHMERNPRCVIEGSKKLIWNRIRDDWELYDVVDDPAEKKNLVGSDDRLESRLKGLMLALDEKIDAGLAGPTTAERAAALEKDIADLVAIIVGEDAREGYRAMASLNKILYDYLGDTSPEVRSLLKEEGLDRIALDFVRRAAELKGGVRIRAVNMVAEMARPVTAEFLRAEVKVISASTLPCAIALAQIGDDAGRAALDYAFGSEGFDKRDVAIGLGYLGDPRATPYLRATLMGIGSYGFMGRGFESLGRLRPEGIGGWLLEGTAENFWRSKPLQRKIAQLLGKIPLDDDGFWLLARLAVDEDLLVSEAAEASIAAQKVGDRVTPEVRAAAMLAKDADVAILNRKFELGAELQARAVEAAVKVGRFDAATRFRRARYLHLENRLDEARAELTSILEQAPVESDRKLAARRLAMLAAPARILDAANFGARVVKLELPAPLRKNFAFPCRIVIENTGKAPWQGGFWQHANTIFLGWEDEEGKELEIGSGDLPFVLPPEGVMPGESLTVETIFVAPNYPGREIMARPRIYFRQPWLDLPDQGLIGRGENLIEMRTDIR